MSTTTVAELAALVGGRVEGDGSRAIEGVGDLRSAGADQIAFVRDDAWFDVARECKAGALLVPETLDNCKASQIVVDDVNASFARIALHYHPMPRAEEHLVHETAVIGEDVELVSPVFIGARAVVGAGSRIGSGTIVHAGAVIGERCTVGSDCVIYPRVVLYDGVQLGDRVILHAGAVVGADGFGYAEENGELVKIPQIGSVQIGSDVEIGANTTIDRGALGFTRIGRGSKLDNLVQIAHNCVVGEDVAIAGFSALAGSTKLGDRVRLAGHVVTAGHIEIAADTRVGGNSVVHHSIEEPGEYIGYPLMHLGEWARTLQMIKRLNKMRSLFKRERDS